LVLLVQVVQAVMGEQVLHLAYLGYLQLMLEAEAGVVLAQLAVLVALVVVGQEVVEQVLGLIPVVLELLTQVAVEAVLDMSLHT
jgi:hypothetical protein